ncbi:stimulated by retinoic acid gene 6 protein homolog [Plakobranchus ocellatus]|uniref:Stimulated by retinoic acid gene 6 protein homolog n=1 Tax=Plakobranchus ocellatus TaxID=259542 RepID=A0AAV4BTM7_9GAST|nr:stimulated by retinoic acid gene 6 protein homolog [Plakobranchus ocellatus]
MDTLTRSSRISYCCAFGATAFLVYKILLEQKFAINYDGPVSLQTLIAIVSMFIYGMVFFPVFACLALSSAFSFGLGSLYVWMFFAVDLYKVTECDLTMKGRILKIVQALPSLTSLSYLSISLPLRFIVCCYYKKYFVAPDVKVWESLEDIKGSYQGLHVRKLLRKPDIEM